MDRKKQVDTLINTLQYAEKQISKECEKQVMIEKAINLRLMCDYVVTCSYQDIVLIICMLHDYIMMLDEIRKEDVQYHYYRQVFSRMADRLSEQIEYNYEAAVEKCRKKMEKQESSNDIGEEAMVLTVQWSMKAQK